MSYSNTVTPTAARTTIPEMANGDDLDATNQAEVSQALANRIELNYTRLIPLTIWHAPLGYSDDAKWLYVAAGNSFSSQTTNASEYLYVFLPNLVDGSQLNAVTVLIDGPGGYAGAPAVVNKITLWKRDMSNINDTQIGGTGTDPASFGGSPDFDELRSITISSLTETIDLSSYLYFIRVEHESGANAQAGVEVFGAQTTCTRPTS